MKKIKEFSARLLRWGKKCRKSAQLSGSLFGLRKIFLFWKFISRGCENFCLSMIWTRTVVSYDDSFYCKFLNIFFLRKKDYDGDFIVIPIFSLTCNINFPTYEKEKMNL